MLEREALSLFCLFTHSLLFQRSQTRSFGLLRLQSLLLETLLLFLLLLSATRGLLLDLRHEVRRLDGVLDRVVALQQPLHSRKHLWPEARLLRDRVHHGAARSELLDLLVRRAMHSLL